MTQTLHVVDAFTDRPFAGNPAAVCLLDSPGDEKWMSLVAREMNLAETAFLHAIDGGWSLRWFTPSVEVKLCGHATLASAFVLWETGVLPRDATARFSTLSGWLACRRDGDWIEMDFPAVAARECKADADQSPAKLSEALGAKLLWVGKSDLDYLVEVGDEKTLRGLAPDSGALAVLGGRGVIVTCRGTRNATDTQADTIAKRAAVSSKPDEFDFLSRFFAPAAGINEDPVTGSAHCTLGPFWQSKLGKADFTAYQASQRGGVVKLSVRGDRVLLRGQAVMMSRVEMMASRIA